MSAVSEMSRQRTTRNSSRLDPEQVGSLRHIENLSKQLDGDWSLMGPRSGLQEDFGAYRFQMGYIGLGLALAHYHRLPNAPGVFKPIFERLIHKMLLPDVWIYWHFVSQGGAPTNAHLYGKIPALWDPVKTDNIMYSAYLLMLTRLYHYLFRDDKYTKKNALTMEINPFTFGERMVFEYDEESLSETIYWQMVENGYLGVACEPNCVFQVCNQPSILSFRLGDFINGTSRAEEVTEGYLKAWDEFGLLDEAGHSNVHVAMDSRTPIPNAVPWLWSDSWLAALMHAWNPDHVHKVYPSQLEKFLVKGENDTYSIKLWEPIELRGAMATVDTADFGWAIAAASELGDEEVLNGFLRHADEYMNPSYRDGGLYYPRNDTRYDRKGRLRQVEPITSNALIPYARFNVPGGLNTFYNNPWTDDHYNEPLITEVSDSVDVLEARFDTASETLRFELEARAGRQRKASLKIDNVFSRGGNWSLKLDDVEIAKGDDKDVSAKADLKIERKGDELVVNLPKKDVGYFTLGWA